MLGFTLLKSNFFPKFSLFQNLGCIETPDLHKLVSKHDDRIAKHHISLHLLKCSILSILTSMNARSYLLCNMLYEGSPILRVSLVWLHFWLANPELVRKCEYPLFFPLALFAGFIWRNQNNFFGFFDAQTWEVATLHCLKALAHPRKKTPNMGTWTWKRVPFLFF